MDVKEFKNFLSEDADKIEKVLESLSCKDIWRNGDEIRCCPPDSSNRTAMSVNTSTLYCNVYAGDTFSGDIIGLTQHFRDEDFKESMRFLLSLFGLSQKRNSKPKKDPLSMFKSIRKQTHIITNIEDLNIVRYDKSILNDFVMLPHINLFYEGIMPDTSSIFNIGYDPKLDRIIFPHFAYDDIDSILGIAGRTLRNEEDMEMFDVPKYYNYIKGYKKSANLYGFSHNVSYIQRDNIIFIFESEKSVLKESTMTKNEGHGVCVGCHNISDYQVQLILKHTHPDVEVVICFDKDVMAEKNDEGKNIGEQYLIDMCNKFSKYRKTSYIWDKYDLLGEKSAPIDHRYKVWNYLVKYRKVV